MVWLSVAVIAAMILFLVWQAAQRNDESPRARRRRALGGGGSPGVHAHVGGTRSPHVRDDDGSAFGTAMLFSALGDDQAQPHRHHHDTPGSWDAPAPHPGHSSGGGASGSWDTGSSHHSHDSGAGGSWDTGSSHHSHDFGSSGGTDFGGGGHHHG
jgi:hypothetical protein